MLEFGTRAARFGAALLLFVVTCCVAACGGDSGDGGGDDAVTTGVISGIVADPSGGAVSGAEVGTTPATGVAVTDADGAYRLAGVPAGTYAVHATRDGVGTAQKDGVDVVAGGTTIVDLALEGVSAGRIEGVATDAADDAPLVDVTVTLAPGGASTVSDTDGAFAFEDVPAGTYQITGNHDDYAPATVSVVVRPDETARPTLALGKTDETGVISGVVRGDACGAPLVGAVVTTVPPTTEGTTDADGRYRLEGVAPGTYAVHATAAGYEDADAGDVTVDAGGAASWDTCLAALPSYDTTCERCHLQPSELLADLEADPLPEPPGEGGSAGEG